MSVSYFVKRAWPTYFAPQSNNPSKVTTAQKKWAPKATNFESKEGHYVCDNLLVL